MTPEELTPEMNSRVSRVWKRMLNQTGGSKLGKLGVVKKLVESLRAQDIDSLEAGNIYFNPVFCPASENQIGTALAKGAKIITVDINALTKLTIDEGVAMILHEIGHALDPEDEVIEKDYRADAFAVERGSKESVISSLEHARTLWPAEFDNEKTRKRLDRLQSR